MEIFNPGCASIRYCAAILKIEVQLYESVTAGSECYTALILLTQLFEPDDINICWHMVR